jgi:hypothetical protein
LFLDRTRKDSNFKRPHIYATLFQIEKCCLHGLPLRLGDTTSAPERGREIAALNYAIELRSWMAAPDPEQVRLRDIALDSLRAEERGQPVLAATARGMLNWLAGDLAPPDRTRYRVQRQALYAVSI